MCQEVGGPTQKWDGHKDMIITVYTTIEPPPPNPHPQTTTHTLFSVIINGLNNSTITCMFVKIPTSSYVHTCLNIVMLYFKELRNNNCCWMNSIPIRSLENLLFFFYKTSKIHCLKISNDPTGIQRN